MNVDVKIWNIKDGEIVELKVDNTIFVMKETVNAKTVKTKTNNSRNIKISYLQKWIQNNNFKEFTLEQFFKEYPKQRDNNRLDGNISKLINDGMILQLGKDKFTVVRVIQ